MRYAIIILALLGVLASPDASADPARFLDDCYAKDGLVNKLHTSESIRHIERVLPERNKLMTLDRQLSKQLVQASKQYLASTNGSKEQQKATKKFWLTIAKHKLLAFDLTKFHLKFLAEKIERDLESAKSACAASMAHAKRAEWLTKIGKRVRAAFDQCWDRIPSLDNPGDPKTNCSPADLTTKVENIITDSSDFEAVQKNFREEYRRGLREYKEAAHADMKQNREDRLQRMREIMARSESRIESIQTYKNPILGLSEYLLKMNRPQPTTPSARKAPNFPSYHCISTTRSTNYGDQTSTDCTPLP